jgi:competence transcription factor ComK
MIFRGQLAEDSSRANETIAARDNEINALRTTVQSVISRSCSFFTLHDSRYARAEN